jgi:hypothetical protein
MGKKHTTQELNEAANQYFVKEKVLEAIEIEKKLCVNSFTAYVEAEAFIGNPYSLLGRVMMVRKNDGKCPESFTDKGYMTQLVALPIPEIDIDEKSKIDQPIQRGSIIVTKDISAKVGFLNYLSAEFESNVNFSIMVFDQMTGLIDVQATSWKKGINMWTSEPQNLYLLQDPDICYLYIIVGFVRKDVIRKKYIKLDTNAKGGAYGININGEVHTSDENYFHDIRFGITPVILKSPTFTIQLPKAELIDKMALVTELSHSTSSLVNFSLENADSLNYSLPNENELSVFTGISKIG